MHGLWEAFKEGGWGMYPILLCSIIEIGKSLSVRVVAEGVETLDHANLLCGLGCDVLQGYYFSHPLYPDDVPAILEQDFNSYFRGEV